MKTAACIIARTTSSRLPIKILRDCGFGYSIISLLIKRLQSLNLDYIYLCTSSEPVDDIMEDIAIHHGIDIYRGSPDEVIERMVSVSRITKADILLRITGDNPLTSIEYINEQIDMIEKECLDYVRLIDVPVGSTAEAIGSEALLNYYHNNDPKVSEYMMLYLFNPQKYRCGVIKPFKGDYSDYSVTIDTPEDLIRLRKTLRYYGKYFSNPQKIKLKDVVEYYVNDKKIKNHKIKKNGIVKLPYGKDISYSKMNLDLKNRAKNSTLLKLF